jgi:hypothetical protein
MMAVARGDLRARFTTPKGATVQALSSGLLYLVAFFGASPDGAPGRPALAAISSLYLVMVAYLCAALPSGEIAIPEEKGLPDLATTRLPAQAVGWGKALSGAVFAASLTALAVPALSFLLALRALPWMLALEQAAVFWAVGWACAGLGTWMGGAVESDLLRSIALWAALIALLGLPSLSGPVRPLEAAQPFVPFATRAACIGGAVLLGLILFGLCARWTDRLRRNP